MKRDIQRQPKGSYYYFIKTPSALNYLEVAKTKDEWRYSDNTRFACGNYYLDREEAIADLRIIEEHIYGRTSKN